MWLVVVLESYYPSVFHFNNEEDADKCFNKQKNEGYSVHLTKIEKSYLYDWVEEKEEDIGDTNMEEWDIEWYTSK